MNDKTRAGYGSRNLLKLNDLSDQLGKLPPQAVDLEQAILGAILLDKEAIHEVIDIITPETFYRDCNKEIFQAILDLYKKDEPIDILTLKNQLQKESKLELIGGAFYISELTSKVYQSANIEYHARIILEKAMKRELIKIASDIHKQAYDDTTDVFELIDKTELNFMNLGVNINHQSLTVSDISDKVYKRFYELHAREDKTKIIGIPTGFNELDQITLGWQNSDLITIAGRPSMGKTAFALDLAITAAKHDFPVLIFSLEMSSEQLVNRMLSSIAEIESQIIRNGNVNDYDLPRFDKSKRIVEELPIDVIEDSGLKITEIRSKAIKIARKKGIKLIIIDYLQLIDGVKENREQEISNCSRTLKRLAKELNIPVIQLSQLNRSVETRGGEKKPQLSDLRESGAIEQDSDLVIFLYRPEYYNIDTNINGESLKGVCQVIIAKHRNGGLGDIPIRFIGKYTKFKELIN